jgi:egghead protein (zeste-white 4 protein)
VVEVVVDQIDNVHLLPSKDHHVRVIVVPRDYVTPKRSRFKARALHYAMLHSPLPGDAWIVHLDEETQPTSSGIKGICRMIAEEETSGRLRVGQGGILYHRAWREHPLLTLADNLRTGDDFARFYFQHRLGTTIFGLHGSYIVVRNDVEKATGGFDFGPQGDITEDAFWALVGMQQGMRCRWVDGYLEEQATMSFMDFMKQRRRWFHGLIKVAIHAPVKLRWRVLLGFNTLLWGLSPWAMLYSIGHFAYGFEVDPWVRFLANYSLAAFAVLYVVGLRANLDEHGITSRGRRAFWTGAQIALFPVFSTMECLAVLWAAFTTTSGFHVVKK